MHFVFFFFLSAEHAAQGGSQARGGIGATADGLHHSSRKHQIFNPLSEARDRTRILMDTSQIHFHCASTGTKESIL